ncbi:MAG: c-type cytochrome [Burkholderiaceae bacterium]|nr:MAG: c-type cytochrome [Burkholderiaceae bacterium]TAM02869.1 MAG: c-type cytochrome [Pusillimonas sp.]
MNKLLAIAGGSTLMYAVLSVLMAILPGIELSAVPPGPGVKQLTELEAHGREVYISEGCAYCHTQQVRPLDADKVFGRPSAPGDFAFSTPELLGSERTGPDLTNIGMRQPSDVWQYIHLYDPRAVVPQSVMPSFPWLFDVVDKAPKGVQAVPLPKAYAPAHGVVVPSPDAQALIAYLMSLKQAPLPNSQAQGAEPAAPAVAAATPAPGAPAPATAGQAVAFDAAHGSNLFAANCAACHGAQGAGVPGVFPSLAGNAVVNATDPTEHITVVLHGLHGKAISGTTYAAQMPAFGPQLSDADIADIIDHERTSWGNHGPTITAKDVAAVRAKK